MINNICSPNKIDPLNNWRKEYKNKLVVNSTSAEKMTEDRQSQQVRDSMFNVYKIKIENLEKQNSDLK